MKPSRNPIECPVHQADDIVMETRKSLQRKYNRHNLQAQETMGILSRETLLFSQAVYEGKRLGIVSKELERRFLLSWKAFERNIGMSMFEFLNKSEELSEEDENVFSHLWKAIRGLYGDDKDWTDTMHTALSQYYNFSSPTSESDTPTFHLFEVNTQHSSGKAKELKNAMMAMQDIYFASLKLETVPHAKYLLCMKLNGEYVGGVALDDFHSQSYPVSVGNLPNNENDLKRYLQQYGISPETSLEVGTFVLHPARRGLSHDFIQEIAKMAKILKKNTLIIIAHRAMVRHLTRNKINVSQIGNKVKINDELKERLQERHGWSDDLFFRFQEHYFRLQPIIASLDVRQIPSVQKEHENAA